MREVLWDRYRITQEQFQYQGAEICMMFRANTLYNSHWKHLEIGSYVKMMMREVLWDQI